MADNSPSSGGSGDTIATEDIGSVKYQRVKLIDATVGSTTPVGTTANPLKVAEIESDCVTLLSTSLTTTGPTSSIDTTGYGAVVVQISGAWVGFINPEASNDGTTWDTVMVMSRDSLNLQDMITSGGLYTIRPSGKYVRLNVAQISGTAVVVAIGREAEGISAADMLSLAMDASKGTPLNVALQGTRGLVVDQLPEGGIRTGLTTRNYRGFSNVVGTVMVGPVFCGDMNSFSVAWRAPIAANIDVQIQMPDGAWASVWGNVAGSTINVFSAGAPNNSGGQPAFFSGLLYGAQYVRLVHASTTTNVHALMQLSNGSPASFQSNTVNVQQATAGNLQCTATANIGYVAQTTGSAAASVAAVMSPATPAATVIKASGVAARLLGWQFHNSATGLRSVKVFNTTTPVLGSSTAMFEIDIPAGTSVSFRCEGGLNLNVGSTYSVTAAKGLTDNTATGLAANDVSGFFYYA